MTWDNFPGNQLWIWPGPNQGMLQIWFSVVVADLFSTGGINSSCKSSEAEVSGRSGERGKHMTKIYYIKKN